MIGREGNGVEMTGRELIEWIIENEAEDAVVTVGYRDDGVAYYGVGEDLELLIVDGDKGHPGMDTAPYKRIVL